jgi:NADPH:quinone reductase-like Zn-dependent oxidoreductase
MSNNQIQAITVDQSAQDRLAVRRVDFSPAMPGEVTVLVTTISLNRGETKRALTTSVTGTRPGWDFAGVVEEGGAVAGAPEPGTRVVGLLPIGAWAERVHAPLTSIALIPDEITDAQAACLPLAGLTALHALRKGGLLLGRKVLVDGATGGVGQIAIQLAAASGAHVYSHIRREEQRDLVAASSTGGVVVGDSLEAARPHGPFDLILDSVGGSAFSAAMTMLRRRGTCVMIGMSEGAEARFDSNRFLFALGTTLQSMVIFDDIASTEPAGNGVALLLDLVKRGQLKPCIGIEAPWTDVAGVAQQLIARSIAGKAVLHLPH